MRAALAVAAKDLRLELRGREVVVTLAVFSFLILTLFSLSAEPGSTAPREMGPGILVISFLFAGVLGLGRSFDRERENECFRGLLMAPCDPSQIYWGKCLSTLAFMLLFQILLWPVFCVFYGFDIVAGIPAVWAGLVLGDLGFVALGVVLAAAAIHLRSREVILPLLLLPLSLPVLVGAVRCVAAGVSGGGVGQAGPWIGRLAAFDAIFLALGTVLFPLVVEE